LLGDLSAAATAAGCDVLTTDPLETCVFQVQHTVPGSASDPYVNEVTVTYQVDGFPNQITHSTTHSVNLFQPSIAFDKTGDALSKVTDAVNYVITLDNTSSLDSPALECTITDALLGINVSVTLASGGQHVINTSRVVQSGDLDPLVNTANVTCSPIGFPNVLTATASHSVNLFQPGVDVTKTGDTLSKIGDQVTYDFTITNTGSHDSPNLLLDSVSDTVLGNLVTAANAAGCGTLAPETSDGAGDGQSCNFSVDYTIQGQDPDPLVNVVTVHYHPEGFPNDISDSDDHSVNLFQPDVDVTKTGDTLSKVGDQVTYDFTITNTGSHDSPDLLLDNVSDTVLGFLTAAATAAGCGTLAPETSESAGDGQSCSFSVDYTIQVQNPDPLVNVVTVNYHPEGFPNDISDSDSHSVNLFQPSVMVIKTGDTLSKVGDQVTYDFTILNNGSFDSPDLLLDSVSDTVLGNLTAAATAAGCGALAPETSDGAGDGESCSFSVNYTIQGQDPDPLVNVVTVNYHPDGFPNDISDSDDHSLNLFQPGVEVMKTGDDLSKVGDQVTYDFTITNTGSHDSPDLLLDSISDTVLGNLAAAANAAGCGALSPETSESAGDGESCSFSVDYTIQGQDPDPLVNVVTVHYHPDGFPNDITDSDDHSLNLFQPDFTITKEGDELSKIGDVVTYTFTIANTSSSDSPALNLASISDDKLGNLMTAATTAGCGTLAPETSDGAGDGQTCNFQVVHTIPGSATDPYENIVTAIYSPDGFPNQLTRSDTHSVNLFGPGFFITKTGDELSKIGDQVTYTFTITNTSSIDSPDLNLLSISDDKLGDLSAAATAAGCDVLTTAPPETCTFQVQHTIPGAASDPYVNTVTVTYQVAGFPNQATDVANHSVNLFQPAVDVTKSGDTLSKIGDQVTYAFTITNTGSHDSPDLLLDSVSDTVLGNLTATATAAGCGALSPETSMGVGDGQSCNFSVDYTVQAGDDDPLVNVVTVNYHPDGFPNDISDSDNHNLNLFQPSFTITKTGDELSKIGDDVTYTFTITNTSSSDSPNLNLVSISDDKLGDLSAAATAAGCDILTADPSEICIFQVQHTIPGVASDPYVNEVTVTYQVDGFPNQITHSTTHSVNLFQPSVMVIKTGDNLSKIGDQVTYDFTIINNGSFDSPDLLLNSVSDTVLGNLMTAATAAGCGALSPETSENAGDGESCSFSVDYTVQTGDDDPLVNTVTVHYNPDGFENDISDSDNHSLNLFQPGLTLSKVCAPVSASVGDTITYTFVVANTGSADSPDLVLASATDSLLGDISVSFPTSMAAGDTATIELTRDIQSGDPDPLVNEVDVLYHPVGFPNDISGEASCSVGVPSPTPTPVVLEVTATPTPVPLPAALPPTGGVGALPQDSATLILFALIGITLIGGSAWIIWSNRHREDRHGSRF